MLGVFVWTCRSEQNPEGTHDAHDDQKRAHASEEETENWRQKPDGPEDQGSAE
jgi:hypothetical protein